MLLNDLPCNGQAKAETAIQFIAVFFEMREPVKDACAIFGRNANALILDRDRHPVADFCKRYFNIPPPDC